MGYPFFPYTVKAAQEAGIDDVSEINRNCGFATRLRELRTGAEISQAALAKELGIVKSTLGLYETGDTVPDARTLCAIANYFEVSSDWLLGLSSVKERDADLQAICSTTGLSPEAVSLLSSAGKDSYGNMLINAIAEDITSREEWQRLIVLASAALMAADGANGELPEKESELAALSLAKLNPDLFDESGTVRISAADAAYFYIHRIAESVRGIARSVAWERSESLCCHAMEETDA